MAIRAFAIFALAAQAELPVARLDSVFPRGARQGAEVEATVTGGDLDEPKTLVFSHPGITATLKPDKKTHAVKVAPDVPPGRYDVRFSGALGLSNPRSFVVGDVPELVRTKANNTRETAVPLDADAVFNGYATAAADDFFTFQAKAGRRLVIACAAEQIESRLSPVLVLENADREQIASTARTGLLDFTAPADGAYTLRLHDLTYAGGVDYAYRLSVRASPWIDFVLPVGGVPGAKAKFTLFGRNLPGGSESKVAAADGRPLQQLAVEIDLPPAGSRANDELLIPASATLDGFTWRLKTAAGTSNAIFIAHTNSAPVAEQEPNNKSTEAQPLTPPCELAGQFQAAADADYFRFSAKKGDIYRVELVSNRRGQPTKPILVVLKGETLVQEAAAPDADPSPRLPIGSNDPALRFEAREDGEYLLLVRDLYGSARRDPAGVYRLSIRKEAPDFWLIAVAETPPEKKDDRAANPHSTLLRGGGAAAMKIIALRQDGFAGEIELSAEGLPAGVVCAPARLAAGKNEALLIFTAVEKAAPWAGAVRIKGKAKIGEKEIAHSARGAAVLSAVKDYNTEPVRARLTDEVTLAVAADAAPLSIEPAEEKTWSVAPGAKLELLLKLTRRGEFAKEALKLKAAGLPALDTAPEIDVPAGAATAKATLDAAALKLPAGEHTVYFQTLTKGKFRGKDVTTTIFSTPVRISIAPAVASH